MNYSEKNLISRIEHLRNQLNQNINIPNNRPGICAKTYALSQELDRLIFQYMKVFQNTTLK